MKNYNMDLKGKKVLFLNDKDVLKENDLCRLVVEIGEECSFNLTYKPEDYNPIKWHTIGFEIPGYIGKEIQEYSYSVLYEY